MSECDWSYLQTLRTVDALGAEPMPSLGDLLEFLADDERENMWVILDVKVPLSFPCRNTPVWLVVGFADGGRRMTMPRR